eukprot:SAG31_NODE_23967_length_492_cov_0.786260_1_plen_128_part_00
MLANGEDMADNSLQAEGLELTRLSAVDRYCVTQLDMLVKPARCAMMANGCATRLDTAPFAPVAQSQLFNRPVRANRPIVDYNTQYSGITAGMLEGVTTTCADARAALFRCIVLFLKIVFFEKSRLTV